MSIKDFWSAARLWRSAQDAVVSTTKSNANPSANQQRKFINALLLFSFCLVIALIGFATLSNLKIIQKKTGDGSLIQRDLTTLARHNEALSAYDMLLSISRLRSACLAYSLGHINSVEFTESRLQVLGHFASYEAKTYLGQSARRVASFDPAYVGVHQFLAAAELFGKRQIGIKPLLALAAKAADDWALFKGDLYAEEDRARTEFQTASEQWALTQERTLERQTWYLVGFALMFCVIAYLVYVMRLREQSQRKDLDLIIATLSHDLRSPLQVIQTAAGLLERDLEKAVVKKYAAVLGSSATAMNQLISDLFDLSLGKPLQTCATCIPVHTWFEEIAQFYRINAEAKGLSFSVAIDTDVEFLEFDGPRMRQCVANLVDNAIKYTDAGSVSLRMRIQLPVAGAQEALLQVLVSDSGRGIPTAEQAMLFAPFRRGRLVGKVRGLGLGLSIVKRLIHSFGGTVECRSKVGEGTSFTLTVTAPICYPANDASSAVGVQANLTSAFENETASLLVVDDDPLIVSTTSALLTEIGFGNETASNGSAALALIEKKRFEAVITDIAMPGMDGYALARAIRGRPGLHPFLIAMTAHRLDSDQNPESLFDVVLTKPVPTEQLVNALEQFESFRTLQRSRR